MSETTAPKQAERMPADWDTRLRWPPLYAIYNCEGVSEAERDPFNVTMVRMGSHTWTQSCAEQTLESYRYCETILRSQRSPGRYCILPMEWPLVEQQRLNTMESTAQAEYIGLVWQNEAWWTNNARIYRNHFVRRSKSDPTMLSYYADNNKGCRGIRTKIKPGKYLMKFFGGILPEARIAAFAAWQVTGKRQNQFNSETNWPLAFATTGAEMEAVYLNGPRSCMSGQVTRYTVKGQQLHPVQVYAAGDLAVAHLTGEDNRGKRRPMVRALCWPERKLVGRIYPAASHWEIDGFSSLNDCKDALEAFTTRLRQDGYKLLGEGGDFNGARLQLLPLDNHKNYWLMPYIDNAYGAAFDGQIVDGKTTYILRMSNKNYDVSCQSQSGTAEFRLPNDPVATCARCNEPIFRDRDVAEVAIAKAAVTTRNKSTIRKAKWCNWCSAKHSYWCQGLRASMSTDVFPTVSVRHAGMVSQHSLSVHRHYVSDLSGDTIFEKDDNHETLHDGRKISHTEFSSFGFVCEASGRISA